MNMSVEEARVLSSVVAILVAKLGGDVTLALDELDSAPSMQTINIVPHTVRLVTKSAEGGV